MAIYESNCSEMEKNRIPEKRVGNSQFLWKRAQRVDSSTLNSWITTALIHSGELRAHLVFPVRSAAVDTLEEILGSGLRWEMVLYGEPMEDYMAETDDPVISAIWQGKDVVDFSSVVEGRNPISSTRKIKQNPIQIDH